MKSDFQSWTAMLTWRDRWPSSVWLIGMFLISWSVIAVMVGAISYLPRYDAQPWSSFGVVSVCFLAAIALAIFCHCREKWWMAKNSKPLIRCASTDNIEYVLESWGLVTSSGGWRDVQLIRLPAKIFPRFSPEALARFSLTIAKRYGHVEEMGAKIVSSSDWLWSISRRRYLDRFIRAAIHADPDIGGVISQQICLGLERAKRARTIGRIKIRRPKTLPQDDATVLANLGKRLGLKPVD